MTFQDLGKKSEAKRSFETAIRLDPDNLFYLYNLTILDNKITKEKSTKNQSKLNRKSDKPETNKKPFKMDTSFLEND